MGPAPRRPVPPIPSAFPAPSRRPAPFAGALEVAGSALLLPLCLGLVLALFGALVPAPASAWTVYNNTDSDVFVQVYAGRERIQKKTIAKNSEYNCTWSDKPCNPDGGRGAVLTVVITEESDRYSCTLAMLAGGYSLIYEVGDGYWCLAQINERGGDQGVNNVDVNKDGVSDVDKYVNTDWSDEYLYSANIRSGTPTFPAADRSVRFLVTGDPQIDFRDLAEDCPYKERCKATSGTGARTAQDTFEVMTDASRSWAYGWIHRWNSDLRGIVVSGDLTAKARWDEFKFYTQISTSDPDEGTITTDQDPFGLKEYYPSQEKLYDGQGNHDITDGNDDATCGVGGEKDHLGWYDCEKKITAYVADHPRSAVKVSSDWDGSWDSPPHYSWNWHDVHFVQLNIMPADDVSPYKGHLDPRDALKFLKDDLASVNSEKPVVLVHHYGFDDFSRRDWYYCSDNGTNTDAEGKPWWTEDQRRAYWNTIKGHNVIAIFSGHNHLSDGTRRDTTYGFVLDANGNPTSEVCVYGQGWQSNFQQPDGAEARSDGRTEIEAFVAAATSKRAFLEVTIDSCNTLTVDNGSDTVVVDFNHRMPSYPPNGNCAPVANCIDVVADADEQCQADGVSVMGAGSVGTCSQNPPGPYGLGSTFVDLQCDGFNSLYDQCSAMVDVVDATAPVAECPEVGTTALECGAPLVYEPDVSDNCDAQSGLSVSCNPGDGFPARLGWSGEPVRCDAYDVAGNRGVCQSPDTLTVVDTLAPELTLNGSTTETAECGAGPWVDPLGTAVDQCESTLALTASPRIVPTTSPGSHLISYEARDSSGNVARAKRQLKVVDTQAPELELRGDATVVAECTFQTAWEDPGARALDQCWGELDVTISKTVPLGEVGEHEIVYRAVDGSGIPNTRSRTVTVRDTARPRVELEGQLEETLQCNVDSWVEAGASARDRCSGEVGVERAGEVDESKVGDYVLAYTAEDGVGLSHTVNRTVAVRDTLPPAIVCDADIVVEPTGPDGATVVFGAAATDVCDPAPTVVCAQSGVVFPVGSSTVVTCSAGDAQANTATCSLSVTVLSETEMVTILAQHADALLASGTLNGGQTLSLQRKMDAILSAIEDGRSDAACSQLQGLQDQLATWVGDGTLTVEEATPLQGSAANLQATLGCG